VKVHDFHLENGDERCSIVTNRGAVTMIQVGGINLSLDQLEELYARVMNFDPDEEGTDDE